MKTIKLFCCFLISCSTFSTLFANNPFIASASQAIKNSNGQNIKNENLFTNSTTVTVLEVHDKTETFKIKFVTDNWLDLTNTVTVTGGPGVTFSRILNKGKTNRMTIANGTTFAGNFTYCEVEFKIASNASIGERTVALKRPNLTFGMDEEIFKLKVKKSARICNLGLALGSSQAATNGTQANVQATVHGFDENIRFKTSGLIWVENPSVWMKGKFAFNFNTAFKKSGTYGPADLANDLIVPNDVTLVYTRNTDDNNKITTIEVKNSNPTPVTGGGNGGSVVVRPPTGGGGGVVGGGNNPVASVDLSVTFLSTFRSSGTNFISSETGTYRLCPTSTNPNISRVNNLTIRIINLGTANSNACTVQFSRNSNTNFSSDLSFNIPVLTPGQQIDFVVPRNESRVCATKNGTGACIRCGNGIQGINHWNDKGVAAQILGVTGDTNTSNNSQTIF